MRSFYTDGQRLNYLHKSFLHMLGFAVGAQATHDKTVILAELIATKSMSTEPISDIPICKSARIKFSRL